MTSLSVMAQDQIARLHRQCIDDRVAVLDLLEKASRTETPLRAGVSRVAATRWCQLLAIGEDQLTLSSADFSPVNGRQYYFTLSLEGDEYFFGAVLNKASGAVLSFDLPRALYRVERREAQRLQPSALGIDPTAVILLDHAPLGRLRDISRGGIGLELADEHSLPKAFQLELTTRSGDQTRLFAEVRNSRPLARSRLLGLSVSAVANGSLAAVERGHDFFRRGSGWRRVSLAGQVAAAGADRVWRRVNLRPNPQANVVRFRNQLDQELVGLVNTAGRSRGAPAVLIPPAWGKTKETLLPLALTIVETCAQNDLPVTVLRFDGTNRRGESFIDPECSKPGKEYLHFRFSQAVEDLHSAIRYLRDDEEFQSPCCVIISFSLSAIEARRAVAESTVGDVAGWIPVVGMVDLQSGLRSVSGGVDYAEGILKGVSFGKHELVGVLADMDFTGRDALRAGLVFKEDARRDMAKISVPVTWVHGEHDGWIDSQRAKDVLSAGSARNRRFVEVPTGHQLRSSQEALRSFEFIAAEAVRIAWGRQVTPSSPSLRVVDRMREAESLRRPSMPKKDLREFWSQYLLGRQGIVGMELLTATSTYQALMRAQLEALRIEESSSVLDLGSGTGAFLRELRSAAVQPATVVLMDLVRDALSRSRERYAENVSAHFVQVNLDSRSVIPCRDASLDAVLASLLLSYVRKPIGILREIFRVVRPGGRIVVSSLRRDADVSAIYSEGVAELVAAGAEEAVVADGISFAEVQRSFLNEAARLLELEEQGLFKFYDESELAALVSSAGLRVVSTSSGLGDPPQGIVVVAERLRH